MIILLFSTNLSYADEFLLNNSDQVDDANRVEAKESESPIAPESYVLNLNNKQIPVNENLSVDQQNMESEDFVRLLPNENFEEDKDSSLQEEKDIEVFDLESRKNDHKEELDDNIEPNKNPLPQVQQDPDISIADKPDKDNKTSKKGNDTSRNLDSDKIKDSDEENAEAFKFLQLEDLFKDEIAVWKYKKAPNMAIYGKLSENNNNHLPRAIYLQDYNQQIYYCIIENDLSGLRAIVNKLEDIGMDDIFALQPDSIHDLLTFAMKTGKRDIVNFLLYKGAVFNANNSSELLSIAIQHGYFDLAESIKSIRDSSFKKINNDPNSDMYKWAIKVKHHKS
ncbi:MAG: hypothetical protein sL5_05460 [Candidatus Mesenet longicola]|uniref:Ankyrin repeat domain-containing protein n=1 Tax=Candidatus Mesenet longicola TaxID=1892558 RepID=A0A8J3MP17_9RICK|nr:MAG: hypothetical protein sL5_05460 [Candidatus Mesenet longicola]